ncbi:MAG TPA: lytic transglycosylase domain-containing protein [Thermoanaerobaculia bacterium]|nr:lytic transglycosylase domain-containing protein [Thermoanaerobaculia bacterium]
MKRRLTRLPFVGLCTLLFLAITFNSAPSSPSVPGELPEPPDAEDLRTLEELANWVAPGNTSGTGVTVVSRAEVAAALRQNRRGFELFRSYTGAEDRRRLLERLPYGRLIGAVADREGLDGLLVAAVVEAESNFSPAAVSPVGALGLMQVMPDTGAVYGAENLLDPAQNVRVGARYLRDLLDLYSGDLELALAAYNAGPGNVKRFGGVPPFRETRRYVERVLSAYVRHHRTVWRTTGAADEELLLSLR